MTWSMLLLSIAVGAAVPTIIFIPLFIKDAIIERRRRNEWNRRASIVLDAATEGTYIPPELWRMPER